MAEWLLALQNREYTNPFAHQDDELEDLFPQLLQAPDAASPATSVQHRLTGAEATASAADKPQQVPAQHQQDLLSSDVELSPNDAWAHFRLGLEMELGSDAAAALQQYESACVLEPYEETFVFYAADARFRLYRDVETAIETVKWLWSGGVGHEQGSAFACRLASSVAVYCCEREWWAGVLGALEAVNVGRDDDHDGGDGGRDPGGGALTRAELVGAAGDVRGDSDSVGQMDAVVRTTCEDDGTGHDVGVLVAVADGGASAWDASDDSDCGRSEPGQQGLARGLESYSRAEDSLDDYDGDVNHDRRDATMGSARRGEPMGVMEAMDDGSGGSARAKCRGEFASDIREVDPHMAAESGQHSAARDIVSSKRELYDAAPCRAEGEDGLNKNQGKAALPTSCGDGCMSVLEAVGDDIGGSARAEGRGDVAPYIPNGTGHTTASGQQTAAVDFLYSEGDGGGYCGAQPGGDDDGGWYVGQGEAVGTIDADIIMGTSNASGGSVRAAPAEGWASDVRDGTIGDTIEPNACGATIGTIGQKEDSELDGGALVVRDDECDHSADQGDVSLCLIHWDDGVDVLNQDNDARAESGTGVRNVRGSSGDLANEFSQPRAIVCPQEAAAIDESGHVALLSRATASGGLVDSGTVANFSGGRRVWQEERGACQVGREAWLAQVVAYVALGRKEDAVRALDVLIRTAEDEEERRMLNEMRKEMVKESLLLG